MGDNNKKSFNYPNDSLYLTGIKNYLDTVKSTSLVKGKRLHASDFKGSAELISEKQNLIVIFNEHEEEGVVISFLIDKSEDNFKESLGSLYNAEKLLEIIESQE